MKMNIKALSGKILLWAGVGLLVFFLFLGVLLFATSLRTAIDSKRIHSEPERDFVSGGIHYKIVTHGDRNILINITLDSLAVEEYNIRLLMGQITTYPYSMGIDMREKYKATPNT
jgi:hypothetical protein